VDAVVALQAPVDYAGAVGAYYVEFRQVSDDEVTAALQGAPIRPA
jgi:predicted phosphoribosyltransferase